MASSRDIRLRSGASPSTDIKLLAALRFPVNILLTPGLASPKDIKLTPRFEYLAQPTSYSNFGGTGFRVGEFDITQTSPISGGIVANLLDGVFATNNTNAFFWTGGASGTIIMCDWGPGVSIVIDELRWTQDIGASHGTWIVEGGDPVQGNWLQLGASFTLGATAVTTYAFQNNSGYRAYRLRQIAGTTSSGSWNEELEFKLLDLTPQSARGSYGNALARGNRTASITVSTTGTLGGGSTIDNLVDGGLGANSTDAIFYTGAQSSVQIVADFGATTPQVVTGFLWRQDSPTGLGTWVLEGSPDNSSYTQIGSSFTLGGPANDQPYFFINSTSYRYYRLRQTGGTTSSGPFSLEWEFRLFFPVPGSSGAGSSAGVGAAAAVGVGINQAVGSSAGVATVTAVGANGNASTIVSGVGAAAGVARVAALSAIELTPLQLRFYPLVIPAYNEPQPANLIDGTEAFVSDTGQFTKYTESTAGTFAVASGVGTITHAAGANANLNDIITVTAATFAMPDIFCSIKVPAISVTSAGYDNTGVGIVLDANNFVFASIDRVAQNARIQVKIGGTSVFKGGAFPTIAAPFELGFSLVANAAALWLKVSGVWTFIMGANITEYDFRTAGNLTGWKAGFTLASRDNATWDFDDLTWGRVGGRGMRDMTLVTNEDGTPYLDSGSVYFTATIAHPIGGVAGSHTGVFKLNMATFAYQQTGAIMVSRGGSIYNDQSAHIVVNADSTQRLLIATWGNGFSGSIQILYKATASDLLHGSNVVSSMTQLSVPGLTTGSYGAYDAMLAYDTDNARWLLAYTITQNTNFSGNPFYPADAYSTDLSSWTAIGADTGHFGYEGTKLLLCRKSYWVTAGGQSVQPRLYDAATLTFQGTLDGTFSGGSDTQPHAMVFPYLDKMYLLTFDNTAYGTGGFTWGQPSLQISERFSPLGVPIYLRVGNALSSDITLYPSGPAAGNAGAGTSTGASTITGVGVGINQATGSAAGVASSDAGGVGINQATGSAAGVASSDAGGVGINQATGSSTGASTVTGVGGAIVQAVGASAGVGAATAVGALVIPGVGASAGVGAATAVGVSVIPGVGNAAGVASDSVVGVGINQATGAATGTGAASGIGTYDVPVYLRVGDSPSSDINLYPPGLVSGGTTPGTGSAAGNSAVAATGVGINQATGASSGVSTVAGVGVGIDQATGASTGTGAATGAGAAIIQATASASGVSTAAAVGVGINQATGASAGVGTATGVGGALIQATGSSTGTSTVTGVGTKLLPTTGTSAGIGAATATGNAIVQATGSAAGTSTATAIGVAIVRATGSSTGAATASGASAIVLPAVGSASGVSTAQGVIVNGAQPPLVVHDPIITLQKPSIIVVTVTRMYVNAILPPFPVAVAMPNTSLTVTMPGRQVTVFLPPVGVTPHG